MKWTLSIFTSQLWNKTNQYGNYDDIHGIHLSALLSIVKPFKWKAQNPMLLLESPESELTGPHRIINSIHKLRSKTKAMWVVTSTYQERIRMVWDRPDRRPVTVGNGPGVKFTSLTAAVQHWWQIPHITRAQSDFCREADLKWIISPSGLPACGEPKQQILLSYERLNTEDKLSCNACHRFNRHTSRQFLQ